MNLTQENLLEQMNSLYSEKKNWSKVFDGIKKQSKASDEMDYKTLSPDFVAPYFVYQLIKNKVDIKEFEDVFSHIVKKSNSQELGQCFFSYFKPEADISLKQYLKKDRYNNKFGDRDNMNYIFFNMENNKVSGNKETLPYLTAMFKSVTSEKVGSVYENGLNYLFYSMRENLNSFKEVIDAAQNNPAFIKEHKYGTFKNSLIRAVGNQSYDVSDKENKEAFESLRNTLKDFDNTYAKDLIKYEKSNRSDRKELNVCLDLLNLLIKAKVDFIPKLHEEYLSIYKEVEKLPTKKASIPEMSAYYASEKFRDITGPLYSSLEVSLGKGVDVDFTKMDTSLPALENLVYFKALEAKCKKSEIFSVPENVIEYVKKTKAEAEKELFSSFTSYVDLKTIDNYLLHAKLDNDLEEKKSTGKKAKI
jgi:c-di-GMP-binding flagellar brake protein YcgR